MKVNERIKTRRKELGLTLKQVADKLNVSESLISRYESNDVKNMGIDKLIPLAKILKTTPGYLMGWEERENFQTPKPASNVETLTLEEMIDIPLYGKASAGNGYLNLEQEIGTYSIPKKYYNKDIYAVKVSGDSMTGIDKSIPDGSIAIADPRLCLDTINLNGKVCVFEYNDETYIKQLVIDNQNIIRLRSFNPSYDDIIILNPEFLHCKGRVVRTFIESIW